MQKSYRVSLEFSTHRSAIDVSYVKRVLSFRCANPFEAIKYAYDYLHFNDADETIYPSKISVEEVY